MNAKKVVVLGGGTGQGNLLKGLKEYTDQITAIVTVADDGGGSGVLRMENNIIPPGDIRSCLLALSEMDPMLEKLVQHRFRSGRLKGQNFGNLMLLALGEIEGGFEGALDYITRTFHLRGNVLPATLEQIRLMAYLENGNTIIGESNIATACIEQNTSIKKLELIPEKPLLQAGIYEAISNADAVVIGPGSLYTSIIANLLVPGICEAIKNSPAKIIYICNLMTEHGETDGKTALQHVQIIQQYGKDLPLNTVIFNNGSIAQDIQASYEKNGQTPLFVDEKQIKTLQSMGLEVIADDFVEMTSLHSIVHDSRKLAEHIVKA